MRITLIGSGNVATHLAAAFKNAGHRIVQVYSREMQHAALLAYHVAAEPVDDLSAISGETDIFIISVNDDAIVPVAKKLTGFKKLMVHTSGATSLDALLSFTGNAGVFYPLQTFSKTREVDFLTVPLCVEGGSLVISNQLMELARTVSNDVRQVSSAQRRVLHLAAVFACNFPNYLYDIAQQLLAASDLDFSILKPLILETAQKVQGSLPADVQTGPAVRNDRTSMQAHLQMLDNQPEFRAVYELLSQMIIKKNNAGHGQV
ncbi:MAG TPA: DUF2520 domain-containing protein [Mucilaginibacter sp.]|nr:DUF2520 domain-containing protein [Mucilaginibacter sp.]